MASGLQVFGRAWSGRPRRRERGRRMRQQLRWRRRRQLALQRLERRQRLVTGSLALAAGPCAQPFPAGLSARRALAARARLRHRRALL